MSEYVIAFDFEDPDFPDIYDDLPLWSAPFGHLMLEHLPLRAMRSVLDIGCGTGFPLLELAGRLGERANLVGLDIWYPALRRAYKKRPLFDRHRVAMVYYDGGKFPFADGVFDTLISNLGVNNFDDPAQAVRECYRVTQAGGRIAITTNLVGHMAAFYAVFRAVLADFGKADYLQRLDEQEAHRGTVETHSALLTGGGFEIEQVMESSFVMRYADGSALFRQPFIRWAFLPSWAALIDPPDQPAIFQALEQRLNAHAEEQDGLHLTIPMAYIAARKPG